MPDWLTSPEWTNVVKALLHTLWQGAVIAVLLGLALRWLANPVMRYRCALAALGAVVFAGLLTWGTLCRPMSPAGNAAPASTSADPPTSVVIATSDLPPVVVAVQPPKPRPMEVSWTAWLALLWVLGTTVMLGRVVVQVAGAERLRRSSRPLEDARIAALLAEARKGVGLARRVGLAVTDKLTSPVVAGVLVPTLILPLSLTTTLTPEQIRFILLHELAHIRRGDYFASLFQLFAEALLFFNPAVWWISRQIRIEREVCCDALAVKLSGAPADYARTLVRVVENVLSSAPAVVPALGDRREASSLADRLQRMLVPGYRPPVLRLTWRAIFVALMTGGALLFGSAVGTRMTIAALPARALAASEATNTNGVGKNPSFKDALHELEQRVNTEKLGEPEVTVERLGAVNQAHFYPEQWVSLDQIGQAAIGASNESPDTQDGTKPQVLIEAAFCERPARSTNDGYAYTTFGRLEYASKSKDLKPFSRPRIQTLSGERAQFCIGDGTNETRLDCLPTVKDGQVDLSVDGEVVKMVEGGLMTNRFTVHPLLQSGGGLIICSPNADGLVRTNLVVLMKLQIITNVPSAHSAGHAGTASELPGQKVMTFRLNVPRPEAELKKLLLDAGVEMPPTSFICTDTVMVVVHGAPEQLALVNRLVAKWNGYSMQQIESSDGSFKKSMKAAAEGSTGTDNWSPGEQRALASSAAMAEATNLFMRTFKVNTNVFMANLRRQAGFDPNHPVQSFANLLGELGVDWESPPGKEVFYSDGKGWWFVKATQSDLDAIEATVAAFNQPPAEIHIKARFIEVPKGTLENFGEYLNTTNPLDGRPMGILSNQKLKAALQALKARKDVETLGEPEITVTSGQIVQARATERISVLVPWGMNPQVDSLIMPTSTISQEVEVGPVLDAIPRILADGYTIKLAAIPSLTEFLGYDEPPVPNKNIQEIHLPTEFETEKLKADVNLWDGQTLVLSGLTKANQAKTAGEKEMLVFITPDLVDPTGARVHSDDDERGAQGRIPPQPTTVSNDLAGLSAEVAAHSALITFDNIRAKTEASSLVQWGKGLWEAGKLDEAKEKFEKALVLDPEDTTAKSYLKLCSGPPPKWTRC